MHWKEKLRNLGTFIAFTIQGQDKEIDLVPPMPEPTQQVGWNPEKLAELASGGEKKKKEVTKETFGQALSASTPPLIRDCFGPMVEQIGLAVFNSREEMVSTDSKQKQKK